MCIAKVLVADLSCDLRSKASCSVSKALFLPLQALPRDLCSKASCSVSKALFLPLQALSYNLHSKASSSVSNALFQRRSDNRAPLRHYFYHSTPPYKFVHGVQF